MEYEDECSSVLWFVCSFCLVLSYFEFWKLVWKQNNRYTFLLQTVFCQCLQYSINITLMIVFLIILVNIGREELFSSSYNQVVRGLWQRCKCEAVWEVTQSISLELRVSTGWELGQDFLALYNNFILCLCSCQGIFSI